MNRHIKKILRKIENRGYKVYLVGGYVRDYLLNKNTYDIDICTNALSKDLHKLFRGKSNQYGVFNFKLKKYNFDITTFRKELNYDKRKPVDLIYKDTLEEDIIRRDFTINAICLDTNNNIIDLTGGVKDLKNKIIRIIGNPKQKIKEDPLRILRAIRFATVLDFKLDEELEQVIKENSKYVKDLSPVKILQELDKILLSDNYLKGLKLLKELDILRYLKLDYTKVVYVNNIYGMYAQINFSSKYTFTKKDNTNIINIRALLEKKKISNRELYDYGLESVLIASEILKLDKEDIIKRYNRLPIKDIKDLKISSKEIMNITFEKVKIIKNILVEEILNGRLRNRKRELKNFIINRKE